MGPSWISILVAIWSSFVTHVGETALAVRSVHEPVSTNQNPGTAPSAVPPADDGPPVVTVHDIGLHIGGGPNDAETKAPFLRALAASFPEFARCAALAPEGHRAGTFGIDLLVAKDGGAPETSNPRTGIPGEPFRTCIVAAFGRVTFAKPRRGATKLSYALRFDPVK